MDQWKSDNPFPLVLGEDKEIRLCTEEEYEAIAADRAASLVIEAQAQKDQVERDAALSRMIEREIQAMPKGGRV